MSESMSSAKDDHSQVKKNKLDNRHLFRQLVIQKLYEHFYHIDSKVELRSSEIFPAENLEMEELSNKLNKRLLKSLDELEILTKKIISQQKEIDNTIKQYATAWPLEQINPVDLQILRLAIYEGFLDEEVPAKVAINEAIELARDFGGESNIKFVSGVLGNIYADKNKNN